MTMEKTIRTKEQSIVYQNQSHLAQKYFEMCGICPELHDICLVSDLLTEYALNGNTTQLKQRFIKMETYLDEKYRTTR